MAFTIAIRSVKLSDRLTRPASVPLALCILGIMILCHGCYSQHQGTPFKDLPLKKYSSTVLREDFDILTAALKEAHTGLYWYGSSEELDELIQEKRILLLDSLNGLEFYNLIAPIVAFTKEDHCDIRLSEEVSDYLKQKGKFIPLEVINLDKKVYVLNDPSPDIPMRGWELTAINGTSLQELQRHIFNTFASDGFIQTSKYKALDFYRFAIEYAKVIGQEDFYRISVCNPASGLEKVHVLGAVSLDYFTGINRELADQGIIRTEDKPAAFATDGGLALLTFRSFSNEDYEQAGMNFRDFVLQAFDSIGKARIENLIIDLRENGGGTEGNEDFLFSFLNDRPYTKYKYVEASAFSYTFYRYTDYRDPRDYLELEADLRREHYRAADGRIIRKPGIEPPAVPRGDAFKGRVYILAGGWTYSGGAEFCSLMKEHTPAIFVGEEVGGGFYGNTSGYSLELTLPHTGIQIDVPF